MSLQKISLQDKIALVTGATSGIGSAIVKKLADAGATIVLSARSKQALLSLSQKIDPVKCTTIPADLSLEKDISYLAKMTKFKYGRIDIFIHTAAIWHTDTKPLAFMDLETFSDSEIYQTMSVGITSPMVLLNKLLPTMQKGSKIVNITGTFEDGGKGWIPYFVSKQALEKLTDALADELRERDIQVNAVSPSDTLTAPYAKFFPQYATVDNCVTPDEVADVVLKFCDPSSKITGRIEVVKKSKVKQDKVSVAQKHLSKINKRLKIQ